MDSWTVDIASGGDAESLADLAGFTFPLACPPEATPQEIAAHIATNLDVDHFRAWLADPQSFIVLARSPSEVNPSRSGLVGYVLVCLAPEEETPQISALLRVRPSCELSKCYTMGAYQGTGLASALVARGVAHARDLGQRGMWLGVNTLNWRAIAFYRKCGFQIIGSRRYNVGGRIHDDHIMELALEPLPR